MPRTAEQFKEIRTDRKKAILDAALHVFSEQGYHNTSIIEVSKEAGISKGLIYNYFDSKEELLDILLGSFLDDEMLAVKKVLKKPLTGFTMIEFIKLNTQILKAKLKQWKLYFSLVTQPEVIKILQDLRGMGEQNVLKNRKKGLITRNYIEILNKSYKENYFSKNGLEISCDVISICGWKNKKV